MFAFIRQSQLRLWLLAAAAMLLLTSIIEAGHLHGVISEANDHCVLCQHSDVLDQHILVSTSISLPLTLAAFISPAIAFIPRTAARTSAPIRAPPFALHAH